jgi:adenylate cyclase
MYGELIPQGGGDPIPLLKKQLLVGRRESCDIVLRFANVSAHHCRLMLNGGYWYVRDMQSRNGVKINGVRVQEKRVDPGDIVSVAKHDYEVLYTPAELGAVGPPPPDDMPNEIMNESLLARAGLRSSEPSERTPQHAGKKIDGSFRRYDLLDDREQLKMPDRPV